ncbi:MAG: 2-polyprenyl-6-methoxyphenol hydroxylase [Actinomycetia bacterium]|nr:2-polyprenyl-6-methoxyphenol hydroxylase [Actinomycetes bacterium]
MVTGKGLTAAVVGGGIGGLATAAALTRAGIEASVYEQAPELGEVGAGVLIGPNSVRLLHRLGLAAAINEVGGWVGDGSTYYRHDGSRVAPVMTTDSSGWAAMYGMHRADLIDVLRRAVPASRIHPGHRAVSVDQGPGDQGTEKARVVFENGAVAEADVVIAADGIHSAMRRFVTEPTAPVFSGQISYRGVLDTSRVPWWPARIFQVWMGEGKHVIVFPVRAGRMLNFVCFVPADEEMRESWSAPGDPDALRAAFAGFAAPVTGLLGQVDSTFWWGLYDREPLAEWTRGRLALLGDAAHPMLPHLGQGANQSVEDAFALAAVLKDVSSAEVPAALRHYVQVRRRRTDVVQANSRRNGERYDQVNRTADGRDRELIDTRKLRAWLYDYDVEAEPDLTR